MESFHRRGAVFMIAACVCVCSRGPVQHRGNLHVLRREELLERFLRCHLQCLHLPSVGGLEQRRG